MSRVPSNLVTLQSGISNRHSRTKGDTINGNVYNKEKEVINQAKEESAELGKEKTDISDDKINNEIQNQIEKLLLKSDNPKIEDFGKNKNMEGK